jgi:hypothetical protein
LRFEGSEGVCSDDEGPGVSDQRVESIEEHSGVTGVVEWLSR